MAFSDQLVSSTFVTDYLGLPAVTNFGSDRLLTFNMVNATNYQEIISDNSNTSNKIIKMSDLRTDDGKYELLNRAIWTFGTSWLELRAIHDDYNSRDVMDTYQQVVITINVSMNGETYNYVLDTDYATWDTVNAQFTGAGGNSGTIPSVAVTIRYKSGLSGNNRDWATATIGGVGSVYKLGAGDIYIQTNSWVYIIEFGECTFSGYSVVR